MSQRSDILTQLEADLKANLTIANGYISNVREVRRGIHMAEDMNLKPAISFWCYKDTIEKHMTVNVIQRVLELQFFMYASTKGIGDVDNIHNLMDDVESFLYNPAHWTYESQTLLGDTVIYEGGTQDAVSIAVLELKIRYLQQ